MVYIETRKVVSFKDFLSDIGADVETVMDDLNNSDVSFGTNPDTLLDANAVEEFISPYGFKVPAEFDSVWFSLGC